VLSAGTDITFSEDRAKRFGASAPAGVLLREYGFTVNNLVVRAKALLASIYGQWETTDART